MLVNAVRAAGLAQPQRVVLLAEDEPQLRNLLEVILTQAGYVVIPAVDGQEALELSRTYTNTIDLVVSDIIMPRMTGPDLLEHIRSERPDTQVLLMSGYASSAYIDYATKHDFIRKPFAPKQFMDEVSTLLSHPQPA
jgi:two-component system cell cycle sensor histidine kinase/response regulator CckA